MENLGLVVHDDQGFLLKVVDEGLRTGLLTRDRADEIIRVSVAMANKYVLHKEVDFRSSEELEKVQQTVLKLMGVGLEIRSGGSVEAGMNVLLESSPVELFRLANTRIEKLRHDWKQLLLDHKIEIYVRPEEYENLDELSLQRLSDMSIFSETEINSIQSLTLDDDLFSSLSLVEYYESELERYKFLLRLRDILPFDLMRKSTNVMAHNLVEIECIREALINSIIISAHNESPDPVSVTISDIRTFLDDLDIQSAPDGFPEEVENLVVDLIHELAEGLMERDVELLTSEVVEISRKLLQTILLEQETILAPNDFALFQRWSRIAILQGSPKPLERIFSSTDDQMDEYDFELMLDLLGSMSASKIDETTGKIPWSRMTPDQIITLFHTVNPAIHMRLAKTVRIDKLNATELLDLLDELDKEVIELMFPKIVKHAQTIDFHLEDLALTGAALGSPALERELLLAAGPPVELDKEDILLELIGASYKTKNTLLTACEKSGFLGDLVYEVWEGNPTYLKRYLRSFKPKEVAIFMERAASGAKPKIRSRKGQAPAIKFKDNFLNEIYESLPKSKKAAVEKHMKSVYQKN